MMKKKSVFGFMDYYYEFGHHVNILNRIYTILNDSTSMNCKFEVYIVLILKGCLSTTIWKLIEGGIVVSENRLWNSRMN